VTNNVQQVTIAPVAGQYTIRVRGVSVVHQAPGAAPGTNPRQNFALVVSNGFGLNVARPPAVTPVGIVSAASFASGPVSAGELLSVFGSNLGPTPPRAMEYDSSGNLVTQLGSTRVLFDGQPAPLLFAAAGQINLVAPQSIAAQGSTSITDFTEGYGDAMSYRRLSGKFSSRFFVVSRSGSHKISHLIPPMS
jgi:hypothetical protein